MPVAARDAGVGRFIYAPSSSTDGDHPGLHKVEEVMGAPLSPYPVTKYANELYADVFVRRYGMNSIGLRYFQRLRPTPGSRQCLRSSHPKMDESVAINGDEAEQKCIRYRESKLGYHFNSNACRNLHLGLRTHVPRRHWLQPDSAASG